MKKNKTYSVYVSGKIVSTTFIKAPSLSVTITLGMLSFEDIHSCAKITLYILLVVYALANQKLNCLNLLIYTDE